MTFITCKVDLQSLDHQRLDRRRRNGGGRRNLRSKLGSEEEGAQSLDMWRTRPGSEEEGVQSLDRRRMNGSEEEEAWIVEGGGTDRIGGSLVQNGGRRRRRG
ncbi:hypothetical protein RIF29_19739 [Crotalaria pallida]|uniref:Uncharacterized protein n=1 Tax=Crotalaria pallida TaxID=3830 RepID=A0AAN9F4A7_CROPI